jgi:capsular exopolysaccharide synthesis family protein
VSRLDADKNSANVPEPSPRPGALAMRPTPMTMWRGAALANPGAASGADTGALLKALARRWPLALVLGLILGAVGAAAAWFFLAAPYTAFAQVQVKANPEVIAFGSPEESRNEFLTFLRTQARHLKSRFVLSAALTRDETKNLPRVLRQADPLAWLEDELLVESQEGSEIIQIKKSGPEPGEELALVNAVIKAYEKEVVEAENDLRKKRLDELESQYNARHEELRKKRDSLRQMAEDLGGSTDSLALSQIQVNKLSRLGEWERQHSQARTETMLAQLRLDAHKAAPPKVPETPNLDATVDAAFEADPEIKILKDKLEKYQDVVAEYERRRPNSEDAVKKSAQREADKLEKKLDDKRAKMRAGFQERFEAEAKAKFDTARAEYEAMRPGLEKQVEIWTKEEQRLRQEIELLAKEAATFGRSSTAFEMLKTEVARDSDFVTEIGKKRDILRMEQRRPPRITIFQEAALQKHDMKRQMLSAAFAALAGLFLAGFAVSWLECRARRIHSADEVTTGLGLRVVGAVPPSAPPPLRLAAVSGKEQPDEHHFLESIDGIRTMLLRDARSAGLRLVMVTSAVSGEGKTTLAGHLASSLARAGRRTLLIDCDLRRPSAHQLFEVPSHPGLSEVLLGEVPAAEAVRSTAVPGLWLLPAGQWDRAVLRALAGEEVQKVFAALRQHYDFVLIDSHPVLQAADSLLIGLHVDAVILALMRDLSRMPRVSTACQRLTDLGIPVLGAVVNGLAEDDAGYGGYAHTASPAVRAAA